MFPLLNSYQQSNYYPQFPYPYSQMPDFYPYPYLPQSQTTIDVGKCSSEPTKIQAKQEKIEENFYEKSLSSLQEVEKPPIPVQKTKKINKIETNNHRAKVQNTQRNIISNIAHHLMAWIRKDMSTRDLVQNIIKFNDMEIGSEQFFAIFKKIKLKNYVRKITLEELWRCNKQPQFSKIFRILSYYYLNGRCFSSILDSRKIKIHLKAQHISKIRDLSLSLRQ